jgi:raffinose/stachyose/melibiose transport system permease protein
VTVSSTAPLSGAPARSTPRATRWRRPRLRAVITTAILLPLGFGWIYPFLWMLSAGFKTNQEIFAGLNLIPADPQFGNFGRAWTDARIGQYFLNTTIVTLGSVALVVVSVSMIGYVLGRFSFPGKRLIIVLFALTVFLPEGYTIIPIFELITRLGLANSLLGVTLAQTGGANVVMVLLFAGYFARLPKELEEAAVLDGAGFFRVFWQIMLPLAKPVIATTIILQFMNSWNAFLQPLVLTLARPDLRTLAVGIYAFQGQFFTDWSGMAAAATISLAPIVVVFLLLQRYFVEGIAGAVKS